MVRIEPDGTTIVLAWAANGRPTASAADTDITDHMDLFIFFSTLGRLPQKGSFGGAHGLLCLAFTGTTSIVWLATGRIFARGQTVCLRPERSTPDGYCCAAA